MSSHCLSLQYFIKRKCISSFARPPRTPILLSNTIYQSSYPLISLLSPTYLPICVYMLVYSTCLPYLYKSHVCPPSISSVFHLCVHPALYSICHFSLNLSVCHSITISPSVTVVTVSDICLLLSLAVREVKLLRRQTKTCLEAVLLEKHPCSKFILAVGSNATGKRQCQG